jgi:hypothetical protein
VGAGSEGEVMTGALPLSEKGASIEAGNGAAEADEAIFHATALQADSDVSHLLLGLSERVVGPRVAILAGATTAVVRYAIAQMLPANPELEVRDIIGVFLRLAQHAGTQELERIRALSLLKEESVVGAESGGSDPDAVAAGDADPAACGAVDRPADG